MKTIVFKCRFSQLRLELGPFRDCLDEYIDELRKIGYTELQITRLFRVVLRLSDWIALKKIKLSSLDDEKVVDFLKFHTELRNHADGKTLRVFIQYLRRNNKIPLPAPVKLTCPVDKILVSFETYLTDEKGASSIYIYQQIRSVRFFLNATFPLVGKKLDKYNAQIIGTYLSKELTKAGSSETKTASGHLRQFFKFLFLKGKTKNDISSIVPKPANWRHTKLPIYISKKEVDQILKSCDRKIHTGSRDYAVLMLLSRLGLRACEVVNLNLDDVHWRKGTITIRGKGKTSEMPLPEDAGHAITEYIKEFRPKSPSRSLFLSVLPPHQGFQRSVSVSGIVRFAIKRAGVESKHQGAYLLRHTVANECLRKGAKLTEIGKLLRHDYASTTSIYAKVDFKSLSIVAQPWAGGRK